MRREFNEMEYLEYCFGQPHNLVVAVRIRGNITPERLKSALEKAQQRHPLLKVNTILDRRGIPWFVSEDVGAIPLTVLDRADEDHALRITEKELDFQFDINKPRKSRLPLMRVTLLRPKDTATEPSDVIFCAQHTITDGMSMMFLLRDLLQFMTNQKQAVKILDVTASTQDIFPPDVRERIPKSDAELMASVKFVEDAYVAKFGHLPEKKPQVTVQSSKIHSWQLTADQTEALLNRCEQEHVTVQSALCTAFLTTFAAIDTPVNLRRRRLALPIGEAFGFFATGVFIQMRYDENKGFWDNAREFHGKLQQSLQDPFGIFRLFSKAVPVKEIQKYGTLMGELISDQHSFSLTNLGLLDEIGITSQMGDLRIESFFVYVSPGDLVDAIALAVHTIDGIIHFHIQYMEPATNAEEVEKFTSKAMNLLESAIEQPMN
jgi:NRPS condensation-like uncharacterized protein